MCVQTDVCGLEYRKLQQSSREALAEGQHKGRLLAKHLLHGRLQSHKEAAVALHKVRQAAAGLQELLHLRGEEPGTTRVRRSRHPERRRSFKTPQAGKSQMSLLNFSFCLKEKELQLFEIVQDYCSCYTKLSILLYDFIFHYSHLIIHLVIMKLVILHCLFSHHIFLNDQYELCIHLYLIFNTSSSL